VALIGGFAQVPRYQGSGSSQVVPTRVESAYDAFAALAGSVRYAAGYDDDESDEALLQEARTVAGAARVAVVFVGLPTEYETEGVDRRHLDLPPAHIALVEAVLEVQPRTVVVLTNGAAVNMPWVERVPAIVEGWLGGQAGGSAVVDILTGRVNPSGKLAETFPKRLEDTPAHTNFPGDGDGAVAFSERLFTGHRWYDARGIEPLFPFGHGLSYTTFVYSNLTISTDAWQADGRVDVSVDIRNSGARAGQEIVQLYVHEHSPALARPERELRAFAKVALEYGETRTVHLALHERDFASYDVRCGGWRVDSGQFDVLIGASSRDIRLVGSVDLVARQDVRVPLTRLSPLVEWLRVPHGRVHIEPLLPRIEARFGGDSVAESPMLQALMRELPAGKLVTLGILREDELLEMLRVANA
jgi:beta-glucosidase